MTEYQWIRVEPYGVYQFGGCGGSGHNLVPDSIRNNVKMWDQSIEDFGNDYGRKDASMHEEIMLRMDTTVSFPKEAKIFRRTAAKT